MFSTPGEAKARFDEDIKKAVTSFWDARNGGKGVLSGKTLHSFLKIIEQLIIDCKLPDAKIHTGKNTSQLPGYFRPHKAWDIVVMSGEKLVAAIELKSQVGSIGNNFNNRTEEVLGSASDLNCAIAENAFGDGAAIFRGYVIFVEKSAKTLKTPKITMSYFPVMPGFLLDESGRGKSYARRKDGSYPRVSGISYLDRYDLMCQRLKDKKIYTSAAVVALPNEHHHLGNYEFVSRKTSIEAFLYDLAHHITRVVYEG